MGEPETLAHRTVISPIELRHARDAKYLLMLTESRAAEAVRAAAHERNLQIAELRGMWEYRVDAIVVPAEVATDG